jgi:hypothetical protein
MSDDTQINENEIDGKIDEDRREALRKLGRYSYTAPVMLSLLASKKASAGSFGLPPAPPPPPPPL